MSASGPETDREVLSSFADGECTEFECRLAVRRLVESEAERHRLERYQLIGAVLREEHLVRVDTAFADRVMARLDSEGAVEEMPPAVGKRAPARATRYWRSAGGVALAATVAAATVLGVRALTSMRPAAEPAPAQLAERPRHTPRPGMPPPVDVALPESPELADYLVHHAGFAPMRSTLPYARVVGYDLPAR